MYNILGRILKAFGWEFTGEFPDINKSIIIFAPHTSNWDFVIGKLYMHEKKINARILMKKELFFFPISFIIKAMGGIPIDRSKRYDIVSKIALLYDETDSLHIAISAEGTRKKVSRWKKGFFHIAKKSGVPIVISYIDYKNKKVGIKGLISDMDSLNKTMNEVNDVYRTIKGRYPKNFTLDERFN